MSNAEEKREFSRVKIHLEVGLDEMQSIRGATENISMRGFFVETDEKLDLGFEGKMEILLNSGERKIPIEVDGKVVRSDERGFGVQIVRVHGIESYNHLKNLVMYNAIDVEKIRKEIEEHPGIKSNDSWGKLTIVD